MKIIIVGTAYPYRGGLAAFNERLAGEYARQGHSVEIYTFTRQYPSLLFPGKTQLSNDPAPENLTIFRTIDSCNPLTWLKTGNEIRMKNPDIVIFAYWMAFMAPCFGTIARRIKKSNHTKCIGLIHNMIPHEPTIIDKVFPHYFVQPMDGFVALSKAVLGDISLFDKQNKPKFFTPHPIYDHYGKRLARNEALRLLGLPETDHYLLFFGFIRAYKGLDLLIEAMSDPRVKSMNIKLIVAGEFYENRERYLQLIEKYQLKENIILHTDFIPNSEVNRYFSAADLVAQPYKTATQSGVTQIAFHFEKPMLVTNTGGLAEIVLHEKIGYVVEPNSQEIADAIYQFFSQNRNAEFEKNIVAEKAKYAWGRLVEAVGEVGAKRS